MQTFARRDKNYLTSKSKNYTKDVHKTHNPLRVHLTKSRKSIEDSPSPQNSYINDEKDLRLSRKFQELLQRCEKSKQAVDQINKSLVTKKNERSPDVYDQSKELLQYRSVLSPMSRKLSPSNEKLVLKDLDFKKSPYKVDSVYGELDQDFRYSTGQKFKGSYQLQQENKQKLFERSHKYQNILDDESDKEGEDREILGSPTQKLKKFRTFLKEQEKDMEEDSINLELHYKELKRALEQYTQLADELAIENKKKDLHLARLQDDFQKNLEELNRNSKLVENFETNNKRLVEKEDEINHLNLEYNIQISNQNKAIKNLETIMREEQVSYQEQIARAQDEYQLLRKELEVLKTRKKNLTQENEEKQQKVKDLEYKIHTKLDESQQADRSKNIADDQITLLKEEVNRLALKNSTFTEELHELEEYQTLNEKNFIELQLVQKKEHEQILERQTQEIETKKAETSMLKQLVREKRKQKDETNSDIRLTRIKLEDIQDQKANLEIEKEELKCKLNQLEKEMEIMIKKSDKLKSENSEQTQNNIAQSAKVKELIAQKNNLEAKHSVLEGKLGYKLKVIKNVCEHNSTLKDKKEELLRVSNRSKEHFTELQNKSERLQKKYKDEKLEAENRLLEISQELTKVNEEKQISSETCTKLQAEIGTKKVNKKSSGKDYKRLKSENEILNKTLIKMANDLETIIRQNQEKEDQRKRDKEFKARAYQKIKVLEEIQNKIKHYKHAQKMLQLSEEY